MIKLNKFSLVKSVNTGIKNMPGNMFSTIPNQFEPIRKDLFSLEFPPSMNIPETFIVEAARPKVTNESKEVQFKNLSTWYKGKTKVDPITVTFRDSIGPALYQKLLQWQREHTDFATGKGGYAATYKKTLTLNIEDPTGAVIQKFFLYGCFMTELDGQGLDMTSDDIAMISLTIQMDSFEIAF